MLDLDDKINIQEIVDDYKINVESTEILKTKSLKNSSRIFEVNMRGLNEDTYIVDSISGMKIACHPHLVGEKLKNTAFDAALEAAKAIYELTDLKHLPWNSIVVENVLRAAPSYELHPAFKELNSGKGFHDVWVRCHYSISSYRRHNLASTPELTITYENFQNLPKCDELTIIKPDTEASGRTGVISIKRIVEKCEEKDLAISNIILYGFISIPAIKRISEITRKNGIKLWIFAIGNITGLAHNCYDMVLYGVDESYWDATGKIRKFGSLVDDLTLRRYIPEYIPGMDQPGDWSNRQEYIYIKRDRKEKGRIKEHLEKSIKMIKKLCNLPDFQDWQKEIAEKELFLLHSMLSCNC